MTSGALGGEVTMMKSSAEVFGARLLSDIEKEEGNLESLLRDLRNKQTLPPSRTGIPDLDTLWRRQGVPRLSICGRGLPLLYLLLHHQIRDLHGTVALVDVSGVFSPSHLLPLLSREELRHIHVFRPNQGNLMQTMESLEGYMMWGEGSEGSRGREWIGTMVNGGVGGDVNVGWRGWMRVERDSLEKQGFGACTSVEEAIAEKKRRLDGESGRVSVDWKASSNGGHFCWGQM